MNVVVAAGSQSQAGRVTEWYEGGFLPTIDGRRTIGEERELPVVNSDGQAALARCLWPKLTRAGWQARVSDNPFRLSLGNSEVMPEAGWSTIEMATQPFNDLAKLAQDSKPMMKHLVSLAGEEGLRLLCYGTQPLTPLKDLHWVDLPRYNTLRRALGDNILLAIPASASQQCQVQVTREEAMPLLNVFNGLSGVLCAMFANAPIQEGKRSGVKAVRQYTYNEFPADRVGILPRMQTLDHWVHFILGCRYLFCQNSRGGFDEYQGSLLDYLCETGMDAGSEEAVRAVQSHEGTLWPEARLRWRVNGECTVEMRAPCPQLPDEHSVSAVALGLAENLDEAGQMLDELSWEQWKEVRQKAIIHGLDFSLPATRRQAKSMALDLLGIARRGLEARGRSEEVFLEPLEERVKAGRCLADEALEIYNRCGVVGMIQHVAWPMVD